MAIPKGFFPQQDTGHDQRHIRGRQDVSFAEMVRRQAALGAIVLKDPAVAHVAMSIGGTGNALNAGRLFITLKPRDQRTATADQIIARLRPQIDKVEGAKLFMQAAQDMTVGGRASRTQYQYTLQGSDLDALNEWAPKLLAKLQTLPELRDVATDQQTAGTTLTLTFNRDQASRYGTDGADDRRHALRRLRPAPDRPVFHPALELRSDHGGPAELAKRPDDARPDISEVADDRRRSAAVRRSRNGRRRRSSHCRSAIKASSRRSPSASIWPPAWRSARRPSAIQRAQSDLQLPATIIASFQGNAQAFQNSLSTVWILIVAALVVVYLILGMLYESYIHPITIISTLPSAGVGALATLMLFHFDFSLIALIGIILLIGIVKKNGIMLVDFAIVAERDDHLSAHDAVRRAALLRFRPIMMTTMAAMLGGVPLMLGHGHRLGTQTAARLRHRRRPARVPGPDAVHDAGHLYLSRPVVGLDIRPAIVRAKAGASTASGCKAASFTEARGSSE